MQDVADAAGVHRSTASRALNPETAWRISPDVVQRITEAAERLGYRRDLVAASLRNSRTRLVGVIVPDLGNPVFAPILAGIEEALAKQGYSVLIANADAGADHGLQALEGLLARRAEGIILATASDSDPLLARCIDDGVATVLVNRADTQQRLPSATPNDREGMRLAVRHLVELGHRRIAHLAGPQDISTGRLRLEGFRMAMHEAGLAPAAITPALGYTREAGQVATDQLLAEAPEVTAIAAANDLLALGAYLAAVSRGLACPADLSVTGHNDMPLVDMAQPPLTTVRISHCQIGRESARLLLERINTPDAPIAQVRTAPELVQRASTAPPPRR
jgi:LacI family transcriptional regulator